ncbi:hypothetical protein JVU11DRAFT_4086 [Chiua virens]|nr:hypothetical protein JVU11DRAFT_4086 [Chiua virens]
MMPASLSPLALIVPRPNIPASSTPRTPNRSPVASHILLSAPTANRNSTDSWNSSNYDFDDPNAVWKEDQVRLLVRTLDALPAHLITPFNGPVPPSNLLDKIARGISAAKGPNDWPHSIRATRIKLLELARRKAQEERRRAVLGEHSASLSEVLGQSDACGTRTPDPPEVFQVRTNTPIHTRRPVYRQSSMDFMDPDQSDRSESIARYVSLSFSSLLPDSIAVPHIVCLRAFSAMIVSCTILISGRHILVTGLNTIDGPRPRRARQPSTRIGIPVFVSRPSRPASASSSSFGSPMSISAPLRPSSLRRGSTLTLGSTSEAQVDTDAEKETTLKSTDPRRSDEYLETGMGGEVAIKIKQVPSHNAEANSAFLIPATPASKTRKVKPTPVTMATPHRKSVPNPLAGELKSVPRTPPVEPRVLVSEKATPNQTNAHTKKVRKGHRPQLSISSDEEEKIRSKTAKKARTREPSWSVPLAPAAQVQTSLLLSSVLPRENKGSDSGRSTSTGIRSKASTSSNSSTDNELSTASTATAATTVSISSISSSHSKRKSPRNLNLQVPPPAQSPVEVKKSARRNPARNHLCLAMNYPVRSARLRPPLAFLFPHQFRFLHP